jgi:hypothetical protein
MYVPARNFMQCLRLHWQEDTRQHTEREELTRKMVQRRTDMESEFQYLYNKWRRQANRDMEAAIELVRVQALVCCAV